MTTLKVRRISLLFLFLGLAALGCNAKYKLPPLPVVPPTSTPTYSPTPTFTPGCQASGFNTLTGQGVLEAPSYISVSGTPTPTPVPTWTWTGTLPPHPSGTFLLQSKADWDQYVAGSFVPAAPFPIPFDPATQSIVVLAAMGGGCPNYFTIGSVCNDGAKVTVQVDEHGSCCGTVIYIPWILQSAGYTAVIVDRGALPVVINHTFYSYTGPICM